MSDSQISDAISDPTRRYASPRAVVEDKSLTDEQKVRLLQTWEFDVREKSVADEENMAPTDPARQTRSGKVDLHDIREAIREIVGDKADTSESGGPTKHGSTPPAAEDASSAKESVRVADVMKAEVPYCLETDSVTAVRRTLKGDHFRCLAVLNEQRELVGLASASDILDAGRKKASIDKPATPRHLKQDSLRARVPALKAKTNGRASTGETQDYSLRPVLRQRHDIDEGPAGHES